MSLLVRDEPIPAGTQPLDEVAARAEFEADMVPFLQAQADGDERWGWLVATAVDRGMRAPELDQPRHAIAGVGQAIGRSDLDSIQKRPAPATQSGLL